MFSTADQAMPMQQSHTLPGLQHHHETRLSNTAAIFPIVEATRWCLRSRLSERRACIISQLMHSASISVPVAPCMWIASMSTVQTCLINRATDNKVYLLIMT